MHNLFHSIFEEPHDSGGRMVAPKCPNCGTEKDIGGLDKSYGGYQIFCTVCGHNWHIS
jgi:hypothetical protein